MRKFQQNPLGAQAEQQGLNWGGRLGISLKKTWLSQPLVPGYVLSAKRSNYVLVLTSIPIFLILHSFLQAKARNIILGIPKLLMTYSLPSVVLGIDSLNICGISFHLHGQDGR